MVGGIATIVFIFVPLIIVYYYCKKYEKRENLVNAKIAVYVHVCVHTYVCRYVPAIEFRLVYVYIFLPSEAHILYVYTCVTYACTYVYKMIAI